MQLVEAKICDPLTTMSGHSKWAQIKRSKGAKDAKRGFLFSKLSKKITLAAKAGNSPDPNLNFQLRTEIENAKAEGMPNENIERAAKKPFGKDAVQLTEVVYEAYGPFGTAFIIECATDNTNRAVGNVKKILGKHEGNLGSVGSVSWQFTTKGQILIEKDPRLDEYELDAIEAGATDTELSTEGLIVYTQPDELHRIKTILTDKGAKVVNSEIVKESTQPVELSDTQKPKVEALFNELEDDEEVIAVHTNALL